MLSAPGLFKVECFTAHDGTVVSTPLVVCVASTCGITAMITTRSVIEWASLGVKLGVHGRARDGTREIGRPFIGDENKRVVLLAFGCAEAKRVKGPAGGRAWIVTDPIAQ